MKVLIISKNKNERNPKLTSMQQKFTLCLVLNNFINHFKIINHFNIQD